MVTHADEVQAQEPYNDTALQRQRITYFLRDRGERGALGSEIQQACTVPCVTKRISELKAEGLQITKALEYVGSPHGRNQLARYFLLDRDPRQGSLGF